MVESVELTDAQRDVYNLLPDTRRNIAEKLGISWNAVRCRIQRMERKGIVFDEDNDGIWYVVEGPEKEESKEDNGRKDLTKREEYIVNSLPASPDELADDLGVSDTVVKAHIRDIKSKGWNVDYDEVNDAYHSQDKYTLRSSEHIGQRTRQANEWWQKSHDQLIRQFKSLEVPRAEQNPHPGHEDFIAHVTDLHFGDRVWYEDGNDNKVQVYNGDIAVDVLDYMTQKSIDLYEKYGNLTTFDTWHEVWSGDFLTNESIYEGQFEDLDLYLSEQHEYAVDPLIRRLKAISEVASTVNVVAQVGNHGRHRASGSSRQANADLILYKQIRNIVASIREHSDGNYLSNVNFQIGEATNYKNFYMRGGKIKGHVRHGQDSLEHIGTSSGKNRWRGWLNRHQFDIGFMGHHHTSKRLNVLGRPVFLTATPKPTGEFAEKLSFGDPKFISTVFGVNDDGLTFVYPIDLRDYDG